MWHLDTTKLRDSIMNLIKPEQKKVLGASAALVLLLTLTGCGGGEEDIAGAAKGPPANSNSQGASIGVSNLCEVVVDYSDGTADLLVHTTITDKSSGEAVPNFLKVEIQPQQKVKRAEYDLGPLLRIDDVGFYDAYGTVIPGAVIPGLIKDLNEPGAADNDLRAYEVFTTSIDLCANVSPALKTDATAVNANVRVEVYNSNNTYTNSKCSAMIDGGLKIGGLGLCP